MVSVTDVCVPALGLLRGALRFAQIAETVRLENWLRSVERYNLARSRCGANGDLWDSEAGAPISSVSMRAAFLLAPVDGFFEVTEQAT